MCYLLWLRVYLLSLHFLFWVRLSLMIKWDMLSEKKAWGYRPLAEVSLTSDEVECWGLGSLCAFVCEKHLYCIEKWERSIMKETSRISFIKGWKQFNNLSQFRGRQWRCDKWRPQRPNWAKRDGLVYRESLELMHHNWIRWERSALIPKFPDRPPL